MNQEEDHTSTSQLRASVIIVSYNGIRYLEDCLTSLVGEMRDDEIILVDNASRDGSVELIKDKFPVVRLCCNQYNLGFATACNQGADLARGRVLVFLNQDTRVAPGWLEPLVNGLENSDRVGLTTSKVLLMSDPGKIHLCGQDLHYTGLVFGRGYNRSVNDFGTLEEVGAVSGASFAIKRKLWQILGGFDEAFYMYYEETDLSWRAQLAGYICLFVPDTIVNHDYSPQPSNLSLNLSSRNRWYMLLKNWKWLTLLLLSPGLILAELVNIVYTIMLGKEAIQAKIKADMWVLTNFPHIWEKRKNYQSQRVVSDHEILLNRTYKLNPADQTGGIAGMVLITLVNPIFHAIYNACLSILRFLDY